MQNVVRDERSGSALTLVIDRESRRNAINADVIAALRDGLDRAEADPAIRSVVITGAGSKAFCAGGDLQPQADGTPFAVNHADPVHFVAAFLARLAECRLPVIARVNGAAMAGGFGIMCACDMAIATEDAVFAVPEVRLGLFPMMILPAMQRVMSRRRLLELSLTGDTITAAEALDMGLLNAVVPASELDAAVTRLTDKLATVSPTAVRLGKMAFRAMDGMNYRQGLEYAQLMLQNMALTEDAREGLASFGAKRAPQWSGR